MKIRIGKLNDLQDCLDLAEAFLAETSWGWEYDKENATYTLAQFLTQPEMGVLLLKTDQECLGMALLAFDTDFTRQRMGYVSKFYIKKSARGTGGGRKLVEACAAWFDFHKCAHSFATDTGEIPGQGKAFSNVFGKFGYAPCGQSLVREGKSL